MTQTERRQFLIRALLAEDPRYRDAGIPGDAQGQRDLLRALMNVRPPKPADETFLEVQDAYLAAEQGEIVDAETLPVLRDHPKLVLWQGDITTLKADAIVNAANSGLRGCFHPLHGCIDNIIHSKSGVQLRLYCDRWMRRQGREYQEPTGRAVLTPGYNLPARYVLHTVGPIIRGPLTQRDRRDLASCYQSCLELAAEKGLRSVAFCCISTGEFHFPKQEAAEIAVDTVTRFLETQSSVQRVIFNVFQDTDQQIYRSLIGPDAAAETAP